MITSQAQLQERLAQEGISVTQATLSRDLDEIQAIKIRSAQGAMVYAVPEQPMEAHAQAGDLSEQARTAHFVPSMSTQHDSDQDARSGYSTGAQDSADMEAGASPERIESDGQQLKQHQVSAVNGSQRRSASTQGDAVPTDRNAGHGTYSTLEHITRQMNDARENKLEQQLSRILSGLVTSVVAANNLLVVHTPSGAAQYAASALDRQPLEGVLGTIAGDDTVLIIATDAATAQARMQWLLSIAGNGGSSISTNH